jgi:hypothetical protein
LLDPWLKKTQQSPDDRAWRFPLSACFTEIQRTSIIHTSIYVYIHTMNMLKEVYPVIPSCIQAMLPYFIIVA